MDSQATSLPPSKVMGALFAMALSALGISAWPFPYGLFLLGPLAYVGFFWAVRLAVSIRQPNVSGIRAASGLFLVVMGAVLLFIGMFLIALMIHSRGLAQFRHYQFQFRQGQALMVGLSLCAPVLMTFGIHLRAKLSRPQLISVCVYWFGYLGLTFLATNVLVSMGFPLSD